MEVAKVASAIYSTYKIIMVLQNKYSTNFPNPNVMKAYNYELEYFPTNKEEINKFVWNIREKNMKNKISDEKWEAVMYEYLEDSIILTKIINENFILKKDFEKKMDDIYPKKINKLKNIEFRLKLSRIICEDEEFDKVYEIYNSGMLEYEKKVSKRVLRTIFIVAYQYCYVGREI